MPTATFTSIRPPATAPSSPGSSISSPPDVRSPLRRCCRATGRGTRWRSHDGSMRWPGSSMSSTCPSVGTPWNACTSWRLRFGEPARSAPWWWRRPGTTGPVGRPSRRPFPGLSVSVPSGRTDRPRSATTGRGFGPAPPASTWSAVLLGLRRSRDGGSARDGPRPVPELGKVERDIVLGPDRGRGPGSGDGRLVRRCRRGGGPGGRCPWVAQAPQPGHRREHQLKGVTWVRRPHRLPRNVGGGWTGGRRAASSRRRSR